MTLKLSSHAYVYYLRDDQVYWLPGAEFAYNNSVHATIGITPFSAEKVFHPSIEVTVQAILAGRTVEDVPDA
jgi:hypothetical protein